MRKCGLKGCVWLRGEGVEGNKANRRNGVGGGVCPSPAWIASKAARRMDGESESRKQYATFNVSIMKGLCRH